MSSGEDPKTNNLRDPSRIVPLLLGHDRFKEEHFKSDAGLYRALAGGRHEPTALVISCCDARVVPDVILQADPGDLFVLRNIANLVPRFGSGAHKSVGAAIEYAIHGLKVPHAVVCGHTHCGGLKALMSGPAKLAAHMPSLVEWLADAVELRERLAKLLQDQRDEDLLYQLVHENVGVQLENLLSYPAIRWGLDRGVLQLHGWVYNLDTGALETYEPAGNRFTLLDLTAPE